MCQGMLLQFRINTVSDQMNIDSGVQETLSEREVSYLHPTGVVESGAD